MLEILRFTCSGFWVFIGSYLLITTVLYFVVDGALGVFSRFFRMIMILSRGWPPCHLDADGDRKTNNN